MAILDVGHPDFDFIDSKKLDKYSWALIEEAMVTGEAYGRSARVTDDFMRTVERDGEWTTHAVVGGAPMDDPRPQLPAHGGGGPRLRRPGT